MTVGELIKKLKKLDKDLIICKDGYEGGYTDIDIDPQVIELYLNVNTEWYYGEHEARLNNLIHGDKEYEKGKRVLIG